MNNLSFIVTDQSASGSYHVKVLINEKDSGILYLTTEQFDFFVKSLWKSSTLNNFIFNVENPFDEIDFDEDVDDDEE